MKTIIITAISLLLLADAGLAGPLLSKSPPPQPILPPAPSSDEGWYWGLNGGYLWLNDATICGCDNLRYDSGWGVHAAVGYRLSNGISFGLSTGYLSGSYDVEHGIGGTDSADLHMVPVMLNASYTVNLTNSLLLYMGAGLGTAWSELDGVEGGGSDWRFAWQGRAGLGYKVSHDLTLTAGYRYINVDDAMAGFGDVRGHMAEAGLKVNF